MRKQLVTVPSCDEHNSRKSRDDEYFRAQVLVATRPDHEAGRHQFTSKVLKAAKLSPAAYRSFFTEVGEDKVRGVTILKFDRARTDRCVEHTVRALAFHELGTKWLHPIIHWSPSYAWPTNDPRIVAQFDVTSERTRAIQNVLANLPVLGNNPQVFNYSVTLDPSGNWLGFRGQFYEFFNLYAIGRSDWEMGPSPPNDC